MSFSLLTGEKISGEELLELLGIPEEDFIVAAENAMKDKFADLNDLNGELDSSSYQVRYDNTLSPDNCNVNMPMFVDENNRLNIVAAIYVPGDNDFQSEIIALSELDFIK